VVTKKDVKTVAKYYIPLLLGSANQCTERMVAGQEMPEWVMDCVCRDLEQVNPVMALAVKAVGDAVAIQLRGKVDSEPVWRAQIMVMVSVLALLCVIDRTLGADYSH
jgi:hypothetical protein